MSRYVATCTIAVFATCMLLVSCDNRGDVTAQQHLTRAKAHHAQGDLQSAGIELKNALQKEPDNAEARLMLGRMELELQNGAPAEKELRRALELGVPTEQVLIPLTRAILVQNEPERVSEIEQILTGLGEAATLPANDQAELSALFGHALIIQGNTDAAEQRYDHALTIHPNSSEALLGKARVASAQNRIQDARSWLTQALDAHPKFSQAWSLKGDIEWHEGNLSEAESAYGKAIDHAAVNVRDLYARILVRLQSSNSEGAAADIPQLRRVAPKFEGTNFADGVIHHQNRRYTKARRAFEDALNINPNYAPAVFYLGLTHATEGNYQQADRYLARYLSAYPNSDSTARLLGAVRVVQGDYGGAESVLYPVLTRNPDDSGVYELLGNAAMRQGETEQAIAHLERLVANQSESAVAHMKLGLALLTAGKGDMAIEELEAAAQLDPESYGAEYLVIIQHLNGSEYDKALAAIDRFHMDKPQDPVALNLAGLAYIGKEDTDKAQEIFQQALEIAPGHPAISKNLAILLLKQGDADGARKAFESVLEHYPTHLDTLLTLADMDSSLGKVEASITRLKAATKLNPTAWQPRIVLARYYLQQGQAQLALDITREIQDVHPDNPTLLTEIGKAQLATNDVATAALTFERLSHAQPDSVVAHFLYSTALARLGDQAGRLREIQAALSLDPTHFPARLAMLDVLIQDGSLEQAAALGMELKELQPANPEVLSQVGRLALLQGRPEEAVAVYQEALERFPSGSNWAVNLADSQWQAGDRESAVATLREYSLQHPENEPLLERLAGFYLELGDSKSARETYERVVKLNATRVSALNNLAWLLRDDNPVQALKYARSALELTPESPEVMDTMGFLLTKKGETEQALRLLKNAATRQPENPTVHYHLAMALSQHGDSEAARATLEQVLRDHPSFAEREDAESLLRRLSSP